MPTWKTLEHFYGALYMRQLRRRVIITMAIVFGIGVWAGWWAKTFSMPRVPPAPTGLHIKR